MLSDANTVFYSPSQLSRVLDWNPGSAYIEDWLPAMSACESQFQAALVLLTHNRNH